MQSVNERIPVEVLAEACIIKSDAGYMFVTHEGNVIGPDADREVILTKATLYLSGYRSNKP